MKKYKPQLSIISECPQQLYLHYLLLGTINKKRIMQTPLHVISTINLQLNNQHWLCCNLSKGRAIPQKNVKYNTPQNTLISQI